MKTPKYVDQIQDCESLDFETKMIALCEIADMMRGHVRDSASFDRGEDALISAFVWSNTPQGHKFWHEIMRAILYS